MTIYFNTRPELYKNLLQIKIFEAIILVSIFLFLVLIFLYITKIFYGINSIKKIKIDNEETINMIKKYYQTRLNKLEWKEFIKLLINYLELFIKEWRYKNINDVISILWLDAKERQEISEIIYTGKEANTQLHNKIKKRLKEM